MDLLQITPFVMTASAGMSKMTSGAARGFPDQSRDWPDSEATDENFSAPLTAEQARQWRTGHPQMPVARALAMQGLTGLVVVIFAWLLTRRADVVWSAAYGSLVGVLPAAVAAKGMMRWAQPGFPPAAALAGLLLWEGVKLALTLGMLMAAPRFLGVPSWPALLIGLVLTIKMYWVGLLWVRPKMSGQGQSHEE